MSVDKLGFINLLKHEAIEGYRRYNVLPSLTIAQAIQETGWGKNSIGNNIFGIKADKNWAGKKKLSRTHEYVNGQKIYIDAWFRDYGSISESLEDRYKFLQKPRYSKVVGATDYKIACAEILKAGYATDMQYSVKLIALIEQNKLYEIDKIAMAVEIPKSIIMPQTVSEWAKESWSWANSKGYLDGERPKSSLTRQEFAVLLKRMVG